MKMSKEFLAIVFGLLISFSSRSQTILSPVDKGGLDNEAEALKGWGVGSVQNDMYEIKFSNDVFPKDQSVGYIKSKPGTTTSSGAIYHCISLKDFKGQRVRMTAWAKTSSVKKEAGFWFFCNSDTSMVLDNASTKGTTEWKEYSMVIDVFPYSYMFTCGVFLEGAGEIHFRNINFEVVDSSVPVTAKARKK